MRVQPWLRGLMVGATLLLITGIRQLAPAPLALLGAGPNWPVLWLLPWALVEGTSAALVGALLAGLLADAFTIGTVGQTLPLVVLAVYWSRLGGSARRSIDNLCLLGLHGMLGSLWIDLCIALQLLSRSRPLEFSAAAGSDPTQMVQGGWHLPVLLGAGLWGALAQALMTGLLAPLVSGLLLQLWRQLAVRRPLG